MAAGSRSALLLLLCVAVSVTAGEAAQAGRASVVAQKPQTTMLQAGQSIWLTDRVLISDNIAPQYFETMLIIPHTAVKKVDVAPRLGLSSRLAGVEASVPMRLVVVRRPLSSRRIESNRRTWQQLSLRERMELQRLYLSKFDDVKQVQRVYRAKQMLDGMTSAERRRLLCRARELARMYQYLTEAQRRDLRRLPRQQRVRAIAEMYRQWKAQQQRLKQDQDRSIATEQHQSERCSSEQLLAAMVSLSKQWSRLWASLAEASTVAVDSGKKADRPGKVGEAVSRGLASDSPTEAMGAIADLVVARVDKISGDDGERSLGSVLSADSLANQPSEPSGDSQLESDIHFLILP